MRLYFAALPLLLSPALAHAATPIAGQWFTMENKAVVTIAECGKGMCGRISKVLKPRPDGPTVDSKNPNPSLRNRPIEGLMILANFADAGADWRGLIYSPEEGKQYRSIMKRQADGTLQVKGCILFFCQTQVWRPAR